MTRMNTDRCPNCGSTCPRGGTCIDCGWPDSGPAPVSMTTETIDKLFLELSQFTNAKTARELAMEELLRSAHAIALRQGNGTAWARFADSIIELGIGSVTARTYRILPSDIEEGSDAAMQAGDEP